MVHIISYDLNKSGQNYEKLHKRIKSLGAYYHILDSTWLVSANKSAKEIYKVLRPAGDTNDNIFISRITSDYWGWLPKEAWEWLSTRV